MDIMYRPITNEEIPTFRRAMELAFGEEFGDAEDALLRELVELPRTISAFDGDAMVGTFGAFSFDVTVPGGTLPMGGTTEVTVAPTHRRRGILRAMMRMHFDDVLSRAEPLAGLWASESSIYTRFGFGMAAEGESLKLRAEHVHFRGDPPPGKVRLLDQAAAREPLEAIYERVRPTRPGMLSRSDAWWRARIFNDPKEWRNGRSARRYAVYTGNDGPDGYAVYRQKEKWDEFPDGEVYVVEVVAATTEAHDGLWRYLTGIDLFPAVRCWNLPVDDELPFRLVDSRRAQRRREDTLWLRIMDVARALEGRRYPVSDRLVLEVRDTMLPSNAGTYALEAGPDGATSTRVETQPDLRLDVDALGAVYLGGHRASTLARAGRIHGSEAAIARADRLFAWSRLPWCEEVF